MERYNAVKGCPKCSCQSTVDRYNGDLDQIRRKCTRCEYLWWEEPLDNIVENSNSAESKPEAGAQPRGEHNNESDAIALLKRWLLLASNTGFITKVNPELIELTRSAIAQRTHVS